MTARREMDAGGSVPVEPGFVWSISGATIIVVLGWASTVFALVWKRSGAEATQYARLGTIEGQLAKLIGSHDGLVEEVDQRVSALQAAGSLMREQHHELREHLAKEFMPRSEIANMERRLIDSQSSINNRLDKFETRLDTMQDRILEAIASLKRPA